MKQTSFHIKEIVELKQVVLAVKELCLTHSVFLIDGEMGVGKTTLISQICLSLNILDKPSSPTYSIVNTYFSEEFGEINHFDFYRLEDENEAIESGLDEPLYNGSICFIEWSEKIINLLPQSFVKITIENDENNHRLITIQL